MFKKSTHVISCFADLLVEQATEPILTHHRSGVARSLDRLPNSLLQNPDVVAPNTIVPLRGREGQMHSVAKRGLSVRTCSLGVSCRQAVIHHLKLYTEVYSPRPGDVALSIGQDPLPLGQAVHVDPRGAKLEAIVSSKPLAALGSYSD